MKNFEDVKAVFLEQCDDDGEKYFWYVDDDVLCDFVELAPTWDDVDFRDITGKTPIDEVVSRIYHYSKGEESFEIDGEEDTIYAAMDRMKELAKINCKIG